MANFRVLFTDPPWALDDAGAVDVDRAALERGVLGNDVEVRFAPARARKYDHSDPEFDRELARADALVICRYKIDERVLKIGRSLKVVARQGVGYDNLNAELLEKNGIVGFNIPDYCVSEVATHTLALLLAAERGLVAQHTGLVGGTFNVHAGGMPRRLGERTAGIIGFGRIGRAVSVHLRSLYREVLAYDPYVSSDLMSAYGVRKVELEALLAASDTVTLHCLLNDETKGLIGEAALRRLKRGAVVVNAARGALIEPQALCRALAEGRVGGAALDVFSPENPWEDPWWSKTLQLPNVVVTSHRAFLSREAEESQRRRAVEGVRSVLKEGVVPREGNLTPAVNPRSTAGWKSREGASA